RTLQYRIKQVDEDGTCHYSSTQRVLLTTNVERARLAGCYPNPFNGQATIGYSVPDNSDVTIELTDILGKTLQTLVADEQRAGEHTIAISSDGLLPGCYFIKFIAGRYTSVKSIVVMK